MSADADASRVNLAVRVSDEDHWDIPSLNPSPGQDMAASDTTATINDSEKIDLNRADAATLQTLPNIGEVKAAAIIAYRQANGPFLEVEELVEVSGIGDKTLEALRNLVEIR